MKCLVTIYLKKNTSEIDLENPEQLYNKKYDSEIEFANPEQLLDGIKNMIIMSETNIEDKVPKNAEYDKIFAVYEELPESSIFNYFNKSKPDPEPKMVTTNFATLSKDKYKDLKSIDIYLKEQYRGGRKSRKSRKNRKSRRR
jgi:hypothetical protein